MKIRLLLTLAGLAISFALPTFAQQTNTPDPELRQQAVALAKKFEEAWNNNDAAALAALFTEDGVFVLQTGPLYGRETIEKYNANRFQNVHFSNNHITYGPDSLHTIGTAGNEMWQNGEWSMTYQVKGGAPVEEKGYWSAVYARQGDTWKARMLTSNTTPAPAPTTTPSQTSSKEEKNTVDPQVRQQIEAVEMKFQEAYNNRDAAAIAALYTGDAVEVRTWQGTFSGQEAIMRVFADEFALSPRKMVNKLLQVHQTWTGDICGMMDTSVGLTKGHVIRIYVPSADTWKIRMTYVRF